MGLYIEKTIRFEAAESLDAFAHWFSRSHGVGRDSLSIAGRSITVPFDSQCDAADAEDRACLLGGEVTASTLLWEPTAGTGDD